ncbi:MAG: hypothetical protein ACYDHH_00170 [Solirubrobacteraceae bacterium]
MAPNTFILGTGSGFRLRRPPGVGTGFVTDIDPRVKDQLDTLHALLSADLFDRAAIGPTPDEFLAELLKQEQDAGGALAGGAAAERARQRKAALARQGKLPNGQVGGLQPADVLPLALAPKRARDKATWATGTLAAVLDEQRQKLTTAGELDASGNAVNRTDLISLSEYVDRAPNLSTLKYNIDGALATEWNTYSEIQRRVLDSDTYPALRVYLVAYAYDYLKLTDVGAVKNFLLTDPLGTQGLSNYATIGAARELVADKAFSIADFDVDTSDFVAKIRAAQVGMSSASFEPDVMSVVNDLINDVEHKVLITAAEQGLGVTLPLSTRMMLARYIDAAPVKITPTNITGFATVWLAQNAPPPAASPTDATAASDDDFNVETYQDPPASITVSRSNVLCAGQLYHTMVLGDELEVYSIVHYLLHNYMLNGAMEVTDPVLRNDLQNYVFSGRFTDVKTGRLLDRSRPAERGMFYKQVFALGRGQVPETLIVNDDFPPIWKVLMLQSATYLEKAQASLNPDGFVSKQQVMQAVEDLQYNLSTHCIGMATVATPLMNAELNFCIRRILMHPEVLKQIVPVGGTWWRVVERLYMELKHARPRSTALYQKARLGHDIIQAIANYNPATFEDDTNFSGFISNVDAYITTQSILQQALTDDLKRGQEDTYHGGTGQPPGAGGSTGPGGAAGPSPQGILGTPGMPGMPGMPGAPGAPNVPGMPAMPAMAGVGAGAAAAGSNGHGPASDEWDF